MIFSKINITFTLYVIIINMNRMVSFMKNEKTIYTFKSGDIKVVEFTNQLNEKMLAMKTKNASFSTTLTGDKKYSLFYPYYLLYNIPLMVNKNIQDTLVLGGGGFTYPKYYISKYLDKKMDVVEIDKEIIDVAKEYFFVNDLFDEYDNNHERLRIYNNDALQFVNDSKKNYDYIFLDIFVDNEPLDIFLTEKFTNKIHSLINSNGFYGINYILNKKKETKFKNYLLLLESIFKKVFLVTLSDNYKDNYGNIYILCSDNKDFSLKIKSMYDVIILNNNDFK